MHKQSVRYCRGTPPKFKPKIGLESLGASHDIPPQCMDVKLRSIGLACVFTFAPSQCSSPAVPRLWWRKPFSRGKSSFSREKSSVSLEESSFLNENAPGGDTTTTTSNLSDQRSSWLLRIPIAMATFSIENSTEKRPFQSKFAIIKSSCDGNGLCTCIDVAAGDHHHRPSCSHKQFFNQAPVCIWCLTVRHGLIA